MEESEQRRERLKAMRMEAAEGAETHSATASYSLGNPLVEAVRPEPSIAPRFDFYTDPMSAFSGRTKVSHQTPQPPRPMNPPIIPGGSFGRPMGPPSRPQQGYMNGAPRPYIPPGSYQPPGAPGTYVPPGPYQTPGPFERPMGPPSRPQLGNMNNAPGTYIPPEPYQTPGPYGRPRGPPQIGYMNDAPGAYGFPHQGGNYRGTGFVQRGSHRPSYGPRGGPPYQDSGRGRSQWHGGNRSQNGPGYHQAGRGRGRWQGGWGHHDSASDEFKADKYYNKSMLEDPWKDLQPTLWRGPSGALSTPNIPKPISKKARVSEEPVKYAAGKCLAEDLAKSFHVAKSSEAHDDSTEDNSQDVIGS